MGAVRYGIRRRTGRVQLESDVGRSGVLRRAAKGGRLLCVWMVNIGYGINERSPYGADTLDNTTGPSASTHAGRQAFVTSPRVSSSHISLQEMHVCHIRMVEMSTYGMPSQLYTSCAMQAGSSSTSRASSPHIPIPPCPTTYIVELPTPPSPPSSPVTDPLLFFSNSPPPTPISMPSN